MKKILISLFFLVSFYNSIAQQDSMHHAISDIPGLQFDSTSSLLDDLTNNEPDFELTTFKGIRVTNMHTTEMIGKRNLDFRICHRFGTINSGSYDMYGLDQAFQRMSLTYGVLDKLNIEVGRSSVNKVYDAGLKLKLIRQARADKLRIVSIAYIANMAYKTEKNTNLQLNPYYTSHRLFYTHQLLIARKFSEKFSLQIVPTLLHKNLVNTIQDKNNILVLGSAMRYKFTRKVAFTAEHFYVLPNQIYSTPYKNSLSLGFDIETGGHVFQLHFSNSMGMNDYNVISETTGDWNKGDIRFGFNISRVFSL